MCSTPDSSLYINRRDKWLERRRSFLLHTCFERVCVRAHCYLSSPWPFMSAQLYGLIPIHGITTIPLDRLCLVSCPDRFFLCFGWGERVWCNSNSRFVLNPQILGIQTETAIGVTPDPFSPKTQEKAVWHETRLCCVGIS